MPLMEMLLTNPVDTRDATGTEPSGRIVALATSVCRGDRRRSRWGADGTAARRIGWVAAGVGAGTGSTAGGDGRGSSGPPSGSSVAVPWAGRSEGSEGADGRRATCDDW